MITARCQFLQGLASTAGVLAAPSLLRAANLNSCLQYACFGVGGMKGYTDIQRLNQTTRIDGLATCDIDEADIQRPHTSGPSLLPTEKFADVKRPQVKVGNHYNNFVTSIFGDSPLESPFEIAGPMSEAVILGSVAMRNPGRLFDWNSAALKLTKFSRSQRHVAPVLSGWLENRWFGLRPSRIRRASKFEIIPVKKSFLALVI